MGSDHTLTVCIHLGQAGPTFTIERRDALLDAIAKAVHSELEADFDGKLDVRVEASLQTVINLTATPDKSLKPKNVPEPGVGGW